MEKREYSIGDFSLITRMSVKTLRFYHEKGVLPPSRIDSMTGYRYYDANCVERARIVKTLRELQFSVEEVHEIVRECSEDEEAVEFLRRKAEEIRNRIRHLRRLEQDLDRILIAVDAHEKGNEMKSVERTRIPEIEAVTARYTGRYDEIGQRFGLLYRIAGRFAAGSAMALYWDPEFREDDADVEACVPVQPGHGEKLRQAIVRQLGPSASGAEDGSTEGGTTEGATTESGDRIAHRVIPAAEVLSVLHIGGYDTLGEGYEKLFAELQKQRAKSKVPSRNVFLKGPGMIFQGNPAKYRTEIQLELVE